MDKGSVMHLHTLGLDAYLFINKELKAVEEEQSTFHLWLEEILAEFKSAFSNPEIGLLPKTPSAKRSKRKLKKTKQDDDVFLEPAPKRSFKDDKDSDFENVSPTPPPKKTRRPGRPPSRTASSSASAKPTRSTRQRKKLSKEQEAPKMSLNAAIEIEKAASVLGVKSPENDQVTFTKLSQNKLPLVKSPLKKCFSNSPQVKKAGPGHVKDKVHVFEGIIESNSPTYISGSKSNSNLMTPVNHPVCENVPETPEHDTSSTNTPDTIVKSNKNLTTPTNAPTPTNVQETPNKTVTPVRSSRRSKRRSSRASMRKSLKMLASHNKMEAAKMRDHLQIPSLRAAASLAQDSPGTAEQNNSLQELCSPAKKNTHTKLKLKKKEKPVDLPPDTSQQMSRLSNEVINNEKSAETPNLEESSKCINEARDSTTSSKHVEDPNVTFEVIEKTYQIVYIEESDVEEISDTENDKARTPNVTETKSKILGSTLQKSDSDNVVTTVGFESHNNTEKHVKQADSDNAVTESSEKSESSSSGHDSSDNSEKPVVKGSSRTKQRKNAATSSVSSADDGEHDGDSGIEKETSYMRSTRSKMRKPKNVKNSVTDGDTADDEMMEVEEKIPVRQSTRTKQRKQTASTASTTSDLGMSITEKPVRSSSRTKQRKNTATTSVSSVDEDNMEDDSLEGKACKSTRSKMRKPHPSTTSVSSSDTSEGEDPFRVPDAPPTRTTRTKTRKRHLDEDSSCDESMSKRSCTEQSQVEDSFEQLENMCNKSTGNIGSSPEKFVVNTTPENMGRAGQSFVNNLSKVLPVSTLSAGVVKSFIKRNTPPPKLTAKQIQEQRKKELTEKQKRDEERLQQRDTLLKMRIEEQRKKREERMRKAAEQRQQMQKDGDELKNKLQKKREEKLQLTENLREEKLKEEKEKQKIRLKKLQEAEERRKQDEEERLRKLKEQEEEERRNQEMIQKKREQENEERQRKIMEERKRQEERAAELEKERQAEQDRLKRMLEEEKQKEAERLRQKEQREKMLAQVQAEKERQELEKKKERELLLKKNQEKQKELVKKQQENWEKQKEEQKRQAAELQNLIAKHNASVVPPPQVAKGTLPKPNLNTTHNMSQTAHSDSYEMTPVRKTALPPCLDSYDISDMRSDDSTDDEDRPRKKIPAWALGANLKALLINQHYHPPDLESLFEPIEPPDLNLLFTKKKARFNKRTSSAHWDSPILRPGMNFLH